MTVLCFTTRNHPCKLSVKAQSNYNVSQQEMDQVREIKQVSSVSGENESPLKIGYQHRTFGPAADLSIPVSDSSPAPGARLTPEPTPAPTPAPFPAPPPAPVVHPEGAAGIAAGASLTQPQIQAEGHGPFLAPGLPLVPAQAQPVSPTLADILESPHNEPLTMPGRYKRPWLMGEIAKLEDMLPELQRHPTSPVSWCNKQTLIPVH